MSANRTWIARAPRYYSNIFVSRSAWSSMKTKKEQPIFFGTFSVVITKPSIIRQCLCKFSTSELYKLFACFYLFLSLRFFVSIWSRLDLFGLCLCDLCSMFYALNQIFDKHNLRCQYFLCTWRRFFITSKYFREIQFKKLPFSLTTIEILMHVMQLRWTFLHRSGI